MIGSGEAMGKKKPRNAEASGVVQSRDDLAFRELEAAAGAGLAGLLAFLHARIAGEETGLLEDGAEVLVGLDEGAGDAVAQGAGLAGGAAAFADRDDVVLADAFDGLEGRFDDQAQVGGGEIIFELAVVDDDLAGALGEADAGDGGLAPTGGDGFDFSFLGGHGDTPGLADGLGILGGVGMLGAGIELEALDELAAHVVFRQHAPDGVPEDVVGILLAHDAGGGLEVAALVAGVLGVDLLLFLGVAGEATLAELTTTTKSPASMCGA